MKNIKMIALGSFLLLALGFFSFAQPVSYAEEDVFSDADFDELFSDEDFMNDLFSDDDLMNSFMDDINEEDLYKAEDDSLDSTERTGDEEKPVMDEMGNEEDLLDALLEGGDVPDDLFDELLKGEEFNENVDDLENNKDDYSDQGLSDIGDLDGFLDDYYEPEYVDPLDELEAIAPFLEDDEVEQIIIRNVYVEPVQRERKAPRTYSVNRMKERIQKINDINNQKAGARYRNFFQNAAQ